MSVITNTTDVTITRPEPGETHNIHFLLCRLCILANDSRKIYYAILPGKEIMVQHQFHAGTEEKKPEGTFACK